MQFTALDLHPRNNYGINSLAQTSCNAVYCVGFTSMSNATEKSRKLKLWILALIKKPCLWGAARVYRNKTTIHPRYAVIGRQK